MMKPPTRRLILALYVLAVTKLRMRRPHSWQKRQRCKGQIDAMHYGRLSALLVRPAFYTKTCMRPMATRR